MVMAVEGAALPSKDVVVTVAAVVAVVLGAMDLEGRMVNGRIKTDVDIVATLVIGKQIRDGFVPNGGDDSPHGGRGCNGIGRGGFGAGDGESCCDNTGYMAREDNHGGGGGDLTASSSAGRYAK